MENIPKKEGFATARQTILGKNQSTEAAAESRSLVKQAQEGDKEAFAELVRRNQQRVFAVAGGILRHREDVEDVAQQVFVKAYFSLRRFDQRAAFSTWLYRITVNECWDFLRKKRVRPLTFVAELSEEQTRKYDASLEGDGARPDVLDRLQGQQRAEKLLEGLDARDRLMMILKEVEGFSVAEIAGIVELNANTVKVRLFRARQRIIALDRKSSKKQQQNK